jgi:biopolymer transport protein ExbD
MKHDNLFSEINITPFTDVILVLLIIFIFTANAFTHGYLNINLPQAKAAQPQLSRQLEIYVSKDAQIYIQAVKVKSCNLSKIFKHSRQNYKNIVLKADKAVAYGKIVEILDAAHAAGCSDIALGVAKL